MIRQVMSPSSNTLPDTVPTLPLLVILHWLTAKDWSCDTATVNDLYQFTGTHTCRHTSLSLTHLAQFTASFFLATCYRFNVAAACINATIIIMIVVAILEQVPTSVLRGLRGKRVPAHAGAQQLAGGSGESHPTSKQTEKNACLPFLLLLLPLFTLEHTHHCRQVKPLDFESTLRHSPPREESKNSPLPRFSGYSLGRAQWPEDCQGASVGKTGPSLPTVCSQFSDLSCSTTACHSHGLGDEDFAARVAVLNFGYGGCTPPFALDGFALSLSSLSARCGLSFCFTSCLHPAFYAFANLTLKNGRLNRPFSASNFDSRCHDLLHMSNPLGFTLFHRGFHLSFDLQT